MYDFLKISKEFIAKKQRYVYKPAFEIKPRIKDLMTRGRDFYAIYNEETGLWVTDEAEAIELIDKQVYEAVKKEVGEELMKDPEHGPVVKRISDAESGLIDKFHKFVQKDLRDHMTGQVNQKIIFSNSEVDRKDYATYKLDYPIQECETPYYNKLVDTLYLPDEKEKFEYLIGCVIAGEQSKIQKIFVFYGPPGSGKSTIINKVIVNTIFGGSRSPYCTKFTAGLLANRDSFGTGFLASDPVIAFDDDADLSRIDDATTLNLIISHEAVRVNEKFRAPFTAYPNCLLLCGTNEPVQLSPNSGMNRRLIDIRQTGNHLSPDEYDDCIEHLKFEKSGIAKHCLDVYKCRGKNYYNHYQPQDMLSMTSPMQNFVRDNFFALKDGISLGAAYKLYKDYCVESNFKTILTTYKFRDQLKLYFEEFDDKISLNGEKPKNYYGGFKFERIGIKKEDIMTSTGETEKWLSFNTSVSHFDHDMADCPAQYGYETDHPLKYAWKYVKTTLKSLNTKKLHYVKVPLNHIVIDFDIKDDNGKKSLEKNIEAASKWPPTYAELSKSGKGIHLHYIYTGGDPEDLSRVYGDNVEIKVFSGNSSLRRMLTQCNDIPIRTINSGLPMKGEAKKKMVDWEGYKNEKILRSMIMKNLQKQYHANTKPSIDYIYDLLESAYAATDENGKAISYDVSDLMPAVLSFAMDSSHQADYCVGMVNKMHFKSISECIPSADPNGDKPIVIFDCEVFKNLFVICWKYEGTDKTTVKMINPTPSEVESLYLNSKLIGFNNRKYDNHILYARAQGYTNLELFNLSQRIINSSKGDQSCFFGQAYGLSFTDVYDFASAGNKKGLKKWEIELGIHHQENSIPWDQEVPEERFEEIADYCCNDVVATEAVFHHLSGDYLAREILADLADMTCNDTTNQLTTKIIFNGEKKPALVYTDLKTGESTDGTFKETNRFEDYEFVPDEKGAMHNIMRGVDVGYGGYVYANPGMYGKSITLDVASMHPHSVKELNLFGKYTKNFVDLMNARILIKHKDYKGAAKLFDGKLSKWLTDDKTAKVLSNALKTAINSVYGLTSAGFQNAFKDPRNLNNIVALRGALFMKTLQDEVEIRGFKVIHIKTDSIKIANPTPDIINFCLEFGKKYGYEFEVEHTWKKICLVNNAVYIGMHGDDDPESPREWEATGKQFAVPYVYKTLFTHEKIEFKDMCETFNVQTAIYLDKNENIPDGHNYIFVGRIGEFTPVKDGCDGGILVKTNNIGNMVAVAGTKKPDGKSAYRWLESEDVQKIDDSMIDRSYYIRLVDDAKDAIAQYGDFEMFVSDAEIITDAEFERCMNAPVAPGRDEVPFESIA